MIVCYDSSISSNLEGFPLFYFPCNFLQGNNLVKFPALWVLLITSFWCWLTWSSVPGISCKLLATSNRLQLFCGVFCLFCLDNFLGGTIRRCVCLVLSLWWCQPLEIIAQIHNSLGVANWCLY